MPTLEDQNATQLLAYVLDDEIPALSRASAVSDLIAHLEERRDVLAAQALRTHSLRKVAHFCRLTLGSAHRRWAHLIPERRKR